MRLRHVYRKCNKARLAFAYLSSQVNGQRPDDDIAGCDFLNRKVLSPVSYTKFLRFGPGNRSWVT